MIPSLCTTGAALRAQMVVAVEIYMEAGRMTCKKREDFDASRRSYAEHLKVCDMCGVVPPQGVK